MSLLLFFLPFLSEHDKTCWGLSYILMSTEKKFVLLCVCVCVFVGFFFLN